MGHVVQEGQMDYLQSVDSCELQVVPLLNKFTKNSLKLCQQLFLCLDKILVWNDGGISI